MAVSLSLYSKHLILASEYRSKPYFRKKTFCTAGLFQNGIQLDAVWMVLSLKASIWTLLKFSVSISKGAQMHSFKIFILEMANSLKLRICITLKPASVAASNQNSKVGQMPHFRTERLKPRYSLYSKYLILAKVCNFSVSELKHKINILCQTV